MLQCYKPHGSLAKSGVLGASKGATRVQHGCYKVGSGAGAQRFPSEKGVGEIWGDSVRHRPEVQG